MSAAAAAGPEIAAMKGYPTDRAEIEERDKTAAAYHEAGHAVVALALGSILVRAWIAPNPTDTPLEERTWTGQCSQGNGDKMAMPIIGIAGVVSESIRDDEWDDDFPLGWLCPGDMSDTDEALVGDSDIDEVSRKAHAILTQKWQKVEEIAAALIADEALTDWKILKIWNGEEEIEATEPGAVEIPRRAR